jgi:ABC-type sugar transport system ATPase subunit
MERVADRVGLMRSGRLVQVGTPQELTARPADAWVARTLRLGSVLAAEARPQPGGGVLLDLGGFNLAARTDSAGKVEVLIRPWGVHLAPEVAAADSFAAKVVRVTPRGPGATADFAVGGARLRAELSDGAPAANLAAGETVRLRVDPAAVTVFRPS